jgi:hypothetical protein
LHGCGYSRRSKHWLEHYIAACSYAIPLVSDPAEQPGHLELASRAVQAIELADRCGQHIAFATSKEFWIVAGDPDLSGLRRYKIFRAFQARVYTHPLPAVDDLARYERYAFVLSMVKRGATAMEQRWRELARAPRPPQNLDLEEIWRQELHAWTLAVRLGRFFRQWQTREQIHDAFRAWSEQTGGEMPPVTYPNVFREWYLPYLGDFQATERRLRNTEEMLEALGELGSLSPEEAQHSRPNGPDVIATTEQWLESTRRASRETTSPARQLEEDLSRAAHSRAALWATVRQWTDEPGNVKIFTGLIANVLVSPPHAGGDR